MQQKYQDGLQRKHIIAYSFGNFFSDLSNGAYWCYLPYFFKEVGKIENVGQIMLIGQISDSIGTLIVGFLADRINTRIGQKKPFYILGTFILTLFNFVVLSPCLFCPYITSEQQYILAMTIGNFGFSCFLVFQSLLPLITLDVQRRSYLISNVATLYFTCTFLVQGVATSVFSIVSDQVTQFRIISYFIITLGIIASLNFIFTIDEPELIKQAQLKIQNQSERQKEETRKDQSASVMVWIKNPKFWIMCLIFISARFCNTIFNSFLPFYLIHGMGLSKGNQETPVEMALVSISLCLGSMCAAYSLRIWIQRLRRQYIFLLGSLFISISMLNMLFFQFQTALPIYPLAFIAGLGISTQISTCQTMIADYVSDQKGGSFVYAFYQIAGKINDGLVLSYLMETVYFKQGHPMFIVSVNTCLPLFSSFVVVLLVLFLNPVKSKQSIDQ